MVEVIEYVFWSLVIGMCVY